VDAAQQLRVNRGSITSHTAAISQRKTRGFADAWLNAQIATHAFLGLLNPISA
jgi:hypothetical protein